MGPVLPIPVSSPITRCGFGARCPGRPGRCAAHVKHMHAQAGEVRTHVGLEPRVWASDRPTCAWDPHEGLGQGSACNLNMARGTECPPVCLGPHLMWGEGVFMGCMLPSGPIGLSGLGVHMSWRFLGSLSGALAKGMLKTPVGAAVQSVLTYVPMPGGPAGVSDMGTHAPRCPWRPPRRAVRICSQVS